MLTPSQKKMIKSEIKENFRKAYWHAIFTMKLAFRYLKNHVERNPNAVKAEYQEGWEDYFNTRSYFKAGDHPFTENNKPMRPMSLYEYQLNVTDKIVADYIRKYNFKSVLEIGSGGGLNMMNLAPMFPDVQFYGLELTESGVNTSRRILANPPPEFELAHKHGPINNVKIIHGSILSKEAIDELRQHKFDLVFTSAVLEQLHNYLDVVFENISQLDYSHFLFNEEWLDLNTDLNKYRALINYDYFRASIDTLNQFPMRVIETLFPATQPTGMNYAMVFGQKVMSPK